MPSVTVLSAAAHTSTLVYDSVTNANLAQQIANGINAAVLGHTEIAASNQFGPPPPTNGLRGLFTQATPGVTSLPKGYDDVVNAAASGVIFGSGDANENVLSGAGDLTFFAASGSGQIVTGGGNNLISIGVTDAGNWLIQMGNGNDTIVARGSGVDTIATGTGHNAITLGGGTYSVSSVGSDTITAGSGSETVDASRGGGSPYVIGGSGNLVFIGGAGGATVFGGTGSASLFGGAGPDMFIAQGAASQLLRAGGGNATLTGAAATGADTFSAGAGQDQITGSQGADTYSGGSGQATVNAIGSSNVFQFVHGQAGGSVLVNDLTNAGQVSIVLSGYGPNEAANAVAGQSATASSVTISLSDGTAITFENITHLTSGNFH
jgi:Ca2+-binding RTX toxin-like protein